MAVPIVAINSTTGGAAPCKSVGLLPKNGAATSTGRDLGAVPSGAAGGSHSIGHGLQGGYIR